jgi:hypothetical protein
MKGKGLRPLPLVFASFVERLEAFHQNLGFHYSQKPNNMLKIDIQVLW